jgi:hypothetical protein
MFRNGLEGLVGFSTNSTFSTFLTFSTINIKQVLLFSPDIKTPNLNLPLLFVDLPFPKNEHMQRPIRLSSDEIPAL